MQAGSRCSDGALMLRKHGLVPLQVVLRGQTFNVGRERHCAGCLHEIVHARLGR